MGQLPASSCWWRHWNAVLSSLIIAVPMILTVFRERMIHMMESRSSVVSKR